MLLPDELGGGGLDSPQAAMTLAVVLEQVGCADTGIGFLLANAYAIQSAFAIGPDRKTAALEELVPLACGDEVTLFSLILPGYGPSRGHDGPGFFGLPYQVSAALKDGTWTLSADKARPQCAGSNASFFGVVAETAKGKPGLFLVPSGLAGLSVAAPFKKAGLAASINADITMASVALPEPGLVAQGTDALRSVMSWYYVLCSAVCCGALMASYEILKEWVDTRVIKGKGQVFRENPLVASLLGEIGARTGTARILTYNAARMISRPDVYGPAGRGAVAATTTSVFKAVAKGAMEAMDSTMELMGSAGYATEWNLEGYWRDVKTLESCVVPETVARTDMARHYFGLRKL
jgi:alkylation response protein AidB-like acyl-CoA dehydrogenase